MNSSSSASSSRFSSLGSSLDSGLSSIDNSLSEAAQKSKNFFGRLLGDQTFFGKVANVVQGNTVLERIIFVVLVLIVFVILVSLGSHLITAIMYPADPFIVSGLLTATNGKVIPQDPSASGSIPISRSDNEDYGIEFSWSVWINITNMDNEYDKYKHIFSKGDNNNVPNTNGKNSPNNSPGLYLKPSTNTLTVFMNTFETIEEEVDVANIPLNKWVHVLVRVEGNYLDAYINGILAKRHVMPSVPKQNNGSVYVAQNGGFNGYISNLRYYERALDPGDIQLIVQQGPNLTLSKLEKSDLKSTPDYLSLDWYFQN
jgi:hypothetical protein